MAKDIIVLCIDVGPSMSLSPLDGGETALEKSIRVAKQIVQQKMFAGSKDLLGLVLFGTADTDNELASGDGGYDNIMVSYRPAQPTVDFLRFLASQVKPGDVSADFIDAIVVALDTLVNSATDIKRVGDKKIYIMTDAGSEYSDDQLEQICAGLKAQNVELIVVGPRIATEGSQDAGGGGPSDDGSGPSSSSSSSRPRPPRPPPPVMKKTAQQLAGEAVIGRLVEEVDGACFSFNEALEVSTFLRKNAKKQTARFVGVLEIGDKLKIPCKMYTKVMVERPSSWKKLSAPSQAAGASGGNMAVKMHRTYHLNDEDETEVDLDSVSKGYRYGKTLIPISEADEKAMKFEAPRCLSLMGFTDMANVKQHQIIGSSVQVLVANPDDKFAGRAVSAFIHALYETNKAGIARYVWRKDSQPKVMALIPKVKAESEYLLVVQLPYMEDIRQFVFGSLPGEKPNAAPSAEQLDAVDSLITNMDLMEADIDEDGDMCEALQPKKTCNPLIQRNFQCIAHRTLHPDDPIPDVDQPLNRLLQVPPTMVANCSSTLQRLKDLFPLERVEKKSKTDDAAEVWKKTSDLDLNSSAPVSKRPRTDNDDSDGVDFSMASLAKGKVTKVGTLNPVSDFQTLIAKKTMSFINASRELHLVALELVKESFGDNLYSKAMDCIKALREECIKHSEPEVFNDILQGVRSDLVGSRNSAFWYKLTNDEGVSLISSAECGVSTVSPEVAAQFVESGGPVGDDNATPPDDDMEDPDNLLELM